MFKFGLILNTSVIRKGSYISRIVKQIKWIILCWQIFGAIRSDRKNILKKVNFKALAEKDDFVVRFSSLTILLRCVGTIKWLEKLLAKGYLRECFALLKYIQEDTAVAYVSFERKLKRLHDLEGPKCITELKQAIPDIGKDYGIQNKISHYYYEMMRDSVKFSKKSKKNVHIRLRLNLTNSELKAISAAMCYIMLHSSYWSVFDLITSRSDEELKYWTISADGSRNHQLPRSIWEKFLEWGDKFGLDYR